MHKEAESVSIGVVKVQFSVKMSCQTTHTGLFWAGYFWPVDQAEAAAQQLAMFVSMSIPRLASLKSPCSGPCWITLKIHANLWEPPNHGFA